MRLPALKLSNFVNNYIKSSTRHKSCTRALTAPNAMIVLTQALAFSRRSRFRPETATGHVPLGIPTVSEDPEAHSSKQRKELDEKKRSGILEHLQKEMAVQMPAVPWPGAANGFSVACLTSETTTSSHDSVYSQTDFRSAYWYDASKKV